MNQSQLYIILSITVLALILLIFFTIKWQKPGERLTNLSAIMKRTGIRYDYRIPVLL